MLLTARRAYATSRLLARIRRNAWVVVAVVGVVAGMLAVFAGATPRRSRNTTIGSLLASGVTTPARSGYAGYLVVRARDCNGSLGFLRLLSRPTVARHLTLRTVWLVGRARARDSVAAALDDYGVTGVPVRPAPAKLIEMLAKVGVRRTPILLVTDSTGAFRHAFDAPGTPAEYVAVAQALEGLTPRIP